MDALIQCTGTFFYLLFMMQGLQGRPNVQFHSIHIVSTPIAQGHRGVWLLSLIGLVLPASRDFDI